MSSEDRGVVFVEFQFYYHYYSIDENPSPAKRKPSYAFQYRMELSEKSYNFMFNLADEERSEEEHHPVFHRTLNEVIAFIKPIKYVVVEIKGKTEEEMSYSRMKEMFGDDMIREECEIWEDHEPEYDYLYDRFLSYKGRFVDKKRISELEHEFFKINENETVLSRNSFKELIGMKSDYILFACHYQKYCLCRIAYDSDEDAEYAYRVDEDELDYSEGGRFTFLLYQGYKMVSVPVETYYLYRMCDFCEKCLEDLYSTLEDTKGDGKLLYNSGPEHKDYNEKLAEFDNLSIRRGIYTVDKRQRLNWYFIEPKENFLYINHWSF